MNRVLRLAFARLAFLGQHASIPVVLSHEYAPALAMWTAVVPSTALILGYHFVLKPRRRAQRAA
jgi:DnaJ homolog subfamily C member 11